MGNCASGRAEDCEDSVELRVKRLLLPGGKRGKRKSRTSVRLSSFAEHARRLLETKEGEEELERQVERLNLIGSNCERLIFSVECGQNLRNALKNRYTNILPYDTNRVTLSVAKDAGVVAEDGDAEEDECDDALDCEIASQANFEDPLVRLTRAPSDYVNASPVQLRDRQFIACQGPLPETLAHHWQMIWEQRVHMVAMVTDCFEHGRSACAKYWPDEPGKPVQYGQYAVTMETEEIRDAGCVVRRVFALRTTAGVDSVRQVEHLQYLGLPMTGDWAGLDPAAFCRFASEVAAASRPSSPILVHCDSGVGRTGVLLCLLSFSPEGVRSSQQVDVPAAVIGLRLCRPGMVHSRSQLAFVYKCLLHYLKTENLIAEDSCCEDSAILGGEGKKCLTNGCQQLCRPEAARQDRRV